MQQAEKDRLVQRTSSSQMGHLLPLSMSTVRWSRQQRLLLIHEDFIKDNTDEEKLSLVSTDHFHAFLKALASPLLDHSLEHTRTVIPQHVLCIKQHVRLLQRP